MSAQLQPRTDGVGEHRFMPVTKDNLDQIVAIENTIYQFPWTRRNFSDSIDESYRLEMLCDCSNHNQGTLDLIGYFVLMCAVDEAHLLNLSVAAASQKQGYGRKLLQRAAHIARQHQATSMLLEVRVSNRRAHEIYRHYGFEPVGTRKGYYPHSDLDRSLREDAIVMRLEL